MRISPFTKFIVKSSLLLIAIALLGFTFMYLSNNVLKSRAELGNTVTQISSIEKNQARLVRTSDLLNKRSADIARLTALSVNRDRPLQFIERMEQIGRITNTVLSLNIDETKSTAESLMFRLVIDGTDTSVRKMLRLIEALPYQITIENLSFQKDINQDPASLKPGSHLNIVMKVKAQ
ncbi:MAG: hypothetical protein Q8R40_00465 [bacterium]|nr:hypothetical protein [bacterium]